tara:strand:+ start:16236 stop:16820 length:585 start_codon:yes stop_codon:yes gene_type:complete
LSLATPSLYDQTGRRLYLTPDERKRFLLAADAQPPEWRTFGKFLILTGCRISEALNVTAEHIDFEENRVSIETMKQRRRGVWRRIPLPTDFLSELGRVHDLRVAERILDQNRGLWPVGRTTAFERIKAVMSDAGIVGPQACPKGLRHTFGVHAVLNSVPVAPLQRWMGHARLETTLIYLQIQGDEEYSLAERMW